MENKFSKIIVVGICMLSASCAFDGEYPIKEVAKINEGYYVVKDINTPDYGFMIAFNLDNKNNGTDGEIVTQNCNDIYFNNDTIMYSKILVPGGDTSYYIIPINRKRKDGLTNTSPIKIKEATFKNNIIRYNKVNLDTT